MTTFRIRDGVEWVGVMDWDRRLFDELIPLPDGTSYNAYLVKGSQQTALLDTVDPPFAEVLFEQLASLGVERLDYVVAHHAEQDHSGTLPEVMRRFPDAVLVCTPKAKGMLSDLLELPADRFLTVDDGATIQLGGKTLRFIHFPWVHWPETMVSFLEEDRVLFPCDLFGSHLAQSNPMGEYGPCTLVAAKRYYAEIMMPFRAMIQKNLPKIEALPIETIAPSHGPVVQRPAVIMDAYRDWLADAPRNLAVVAYTSMHHSTRHMVRHLVDALAARGVAVEQFDLATVDLGKLGIALVDAATIVLASPTVLGGAHPLVLYAAALSNALKPKARYAAVIGSFGWGGKMVEQLAGSISALRVEVLEPVMAKGTPKAAELAALDRLADTIAQKHQGLRGA